ncbi:MAG: glycosyltransferase family 9 protein [Candidatus Aureabacteria bacterium]|nr:glycosyltransferase family 9 protein [Candidatus Auribacterota bacterium]
MNVDLMRGIDYWLGIPMCFIMTLFCRLRDVFIPDSGDIKNVLFIELSEMGSAVLADPAMQKVKKETSANLFFLIFKRNKDSLKLLATVPDNQIFSIRENSIILLVWDSFRYFFWCRKNRIDTVVDLELFSRYTALLNAFSGAGKRVGFHVFFQEGLYRGNLLTHKVLYNPHIHITKNYLSLVHALLSEKKDTPFSKTAIPETEIQKLMVSPEQKNRMEELILKHAPLFQTGKNRLVLVNANASELLPQRKWPMEYYEDLIKCILDHFKDIYVFLTGSGAEWNELEELKRNVNHSNCINFAGAVPLTDIPVLYELSHCMITNDSGPAHFASVTNMKTFVLYGPETPRLYGALGNTTAIYAELACSPCVNAFNHRKTPCLDPVCLKTIRPEKVFNLIKPSLE